MLMPGRNWLGCILVSRYREEASVSQVGSMRGIMGRLVWSGGLVACLFGGALPGFAGAPDRVDPRLDATLRAFRSVRLFKEVSISPDGKTVAWVEDLKSGGNTAIYVKKLGGADKPLRVSAGAAGANASEGSLAWSPHSRQLAFLSNGGKGEQRQLYVVPATGGLARKITSFSGYMTDPRWSPSGDRIAVLLVPGGGGGNPLDVVSSRVGVIEAEFHNQRLALVDIRSGAVKSVSPEALHVYEYDWSPDGRRVVCTAAPGPGDANWYVAQLYTLALDTGNAHSIYRPQWQIAAPRWSPDGASIAFIEGLMSDQGITGGDLFTIPAAGGKLTNRTPGRKSSVSWIEWVSPSRVFLTEITGGSTVFSRLDLESGTDERLWQANEYIHGGGVLPNFSLARDGSAAAAIRSSWENPPAIWAGAIGKWTAITGSERPPEARVGRIKSLEWKNEAFTVQGWLVWPRDFKPGRTYPLIVQIHGGPASWARQSWPGDRFEMTTLSALGYFVFSPNPRGSLGGGQAFARANIKDFGGGDWRDIVAGLETVLKTAPVDPNRLGVAGWSYGGYMTMWALTQTQRFKAAVVGAGIANLQSYYGQNMIDRWLLPYFGSTVYDDPAVYLRSSPLTYIKKVKTPAMIVVGSNDEACPAAQSFEYWHALKTLGVPTQMIVYPGEGHMFHDPDHKRDLLERTVRWFDKYLHP